MPAVRQIEWLEQGLPDMRGSPGTPLRNLPMDFDYSRLSPAFDALSKPAKRALINAAIFSPADLAKWTRRDVAGLHGLGSSAFPILEASLAAAGLGFSGQGRGP